MNGVNKVFILGTLGSDPKVFTSREGKPYTTLNLATNWFRRNKDDVVERHTDWHRVTVFGKKGELCQDFLKKGSSVCVEGFLSTYETEENGKKAYHTSITANDVTFLGKSKRAEASADAP